MSAYVSSMFSAVNILQALESYMDLTLIEAAVMCLTRLQPMLKPVSMTYVTDSILVTINQSQLQLISHSYSFTLYM